MQIVQAPLTPLHVHVRYRLGEYMRIVTSHVIAELERRNLVQGKKTSLLDAFILRMCMVLFLPPLFLFKVWKVGACDFQFDEAGIIRRSKGGELVVPWAEVVAIHSYRAGYLFAQSDAAMPVPLRVLDDKNHAILKHYIVRHQASVR